MVKSLRYRWSAVDLPGAWVVCGIRFFRRSYQYVYHHIIIRSYYLPVEPRCPGGFKMASTNSTYVGYFLLDRRQSNNDSMGEGRGVVIPGKGGGLRIVGLQTVGTGTIS